MNCCKADYSAALTRLSAPEKEKQAGVADQPEVSNLASVRVPTNWRRMRLLPAAPPARSSEICHVDELAQGEDTFADPGKIACSLWSAGARWWQLQLYFLA